MAGFLLIHGAWHGAWCWQKTAGILKRNGHGVIAPDLPGLGADAAALTEETDLTAHAAALASCIGDSADELVAVAHSYGGAVLLHLPETAAARLSGRIFLDAVLPEDGEAVMDLVPPEAVMDLVPPERARERIAAARARPDRAIPPPEPGDLGLERPEDRAFAAARLTPQPLASYLEPLRLARPAGPDDDYIACRKPAYAPIHSSHARALAYGMRVSELETGHDAMIAAPADTARAIMAAAEGIKG